MPGEDEMNAAILRTTPLAFAMAHAPEAPATVPLREDGRAVEFNDAEPGAETVEEPRRVLHRLRVDEQVPPWHIAALLGAALRESAIWRRRTFGKEVLRNGRVDDAGRAPGHRAGRTRSEREGPPEAPQRRRDSCDAGPGRSRTIVRSANRYRSIQANWAGLSDLAEAI